MEHIAALLLIVGCSADFQQCVELPSPVTVFESQEECTSTVSPALSALRGRSDKILAQCIRVDPAMEEEDAQLFWDVRDGKLHGSIEVSGPVIAMDAGQQQPNRRDAE